MNKSFKFQSDWPNNGSQSYLLDVLVNDVMNDQNVYVEKGENPFIQVRVNYPNNSTLYSEKIYLDEDYGVKKVEVLDEDGNIKIKLDITSIDYKPSFEEKYFDLDTFVTDQKEEKSDEGEVKEQTKKEESLEVKENKDFEDENENLESNKDNQEKEEVVEESTSGILEDIIYPLYVPQNTHLSSEDTISTDNGNRAILTFAGDSPFVLVEEVSQRFDEMEIIPVNGEPLMLMDSIGAISQNSLYWSSDGVDYYISSTSLDSNELLTIAEGLTGTSIIVSAEK